MAFYIEKHGYVIANNGKLVSEVVTHYSVAMDRIHAARAVASKSSWDEFTTRIVDAYANEDGQWFVATKKTDSNHTVIDCPHCDEPNHDIYESINDDGSIVVDCGHCEKPFNLTCRVTVAYEAEALVPMADLVSGAVTVDPEAGT